MSGPIEAPLVLGGHSYISQLGNEPLAPEREQQRIVEACLNHGIRWFDTTYQPERIALGKALDALGRRDEATILAWSFFTDFGPTEPVGEPEPYRAGHIDVMLEQLRTDHLDGLVVVPTDDPEENRHQVELATAWQRSGYVRSLGVWISDPAIVDRYRDTPTFRFAVHPCNVTTDDAAAVFAACKRAGWETLATSPFVRGWGLDRLVAAAAASGDTGDLRAVLADAMLRFALFQPGVDRVVVAMRRSEWIAPNLASVTRGPLSARELRWLRRLQHGPGAKAPWWRRVLRQS